MATRTRYKELVLDVPAPVMGVNMAVSVDKLQVQEAVDIRGYEFQEYGVLGIPWANVELGQICLDDEHVISAHVYQREGHATQLLWQSSDGTLRYSENFLTCGPGGVSNTTIATGLSTTARMSFVTFLDKVYMSNGVDDYRCWDGTTITSFDDAVVPRMKYLAVWKDSIWGANSVDNPHRVWRSDPGEGELWQIGVPGEWTDIEKGRGLGITSIAAEPTELVVFKYLNTFSIYDPIEYTNRIVDPDKGSVSHAGTVNHNGVLYFISHMGVCRYIGDGPSQIVSEKISPVFDDLHMATDLDSYLRKWEAEYVTPACSFENHIDFIIPLFFHGTAPVVDSYSSFQLYPDYPEQPWLRSGAGGEYAVTVKEPGRPAQQYEFVLDVLYRRYADGDGGVTNCRWWTSWFDFDQPIDEKYLHTLVVLARGLFNVNIFRDFQFRESAIPGNNTGRATSAPAGITTTDSELRDTTVYVDAYGKSFQLNFESAGAPAYGTGESTKFSQRISSGQSDPMPVSRFAGAISRVVLRGRVLGEGYR